MSTPAPNPTCPVCQGRGWFETPYYSDFAPSTQVIPCPDCNPVEPMGRTGCALAVAIFAALIALVAWGF